MIKNNHTIFIDGRPIGDEHPPYVIAEMSGNHNGDINRALALIVAAKKSGADAIKLQTYTADTITINHDSNDFMIHEGAWNGRTLYELYEEAHTPWEWHEELFAKGKEIGITIFSSPFDTISVDFLETLGAPAYKIASFEIVDLPLIKKTASMGKPLIISTGMADEKEIEAAVFAAKEAGCKDLILLHCISGYPSPCEDSNLRTIPDMRSRFETHVGLSDHTLGTAVSVAAVALGACVIEKHFTLSRADGGPDAAFSLEQDELTTLTQDCLKSWKALGVAGYHRKPSEQVNAPFRRSLYVVEDMCEGDLFNNTNVKSIRPGYGLAPKLLPEVLGRRATKPINRGTRLSFDLISPSVCEE
ncbi:pseudaminic acid synthase [Magnetovibrio blakemorei]|uniref:Pseudaminic acid synthase n=1 Tax=Magnetovibrio blakemorei TaxID=28181 RepID=A0A1E5Q6I5_9PROT|nr:pseudaminic acid synthase [Magnetovibrio blakemorei]OEJ66328.1 pseudaminic acid synthase [Magnetovibrio blakemorei]